MAAVAEVGGMHRALPAEVVRDRLTQPHGDLCGHRVFVGDAADAVGAEEFAWSHVDVPTSRSARSCAPAGKDSRYRLAEKVQRGG